MRCKVSPEFNRYQNGGDMPTRLRSITLTSGETVEVSDHLTVIVGPNNVGKTLLLNTVRELLFHDERQALPKQKAVQSLDLELPERGDFESALATRAELRAPGQYPNGYHHEEHFFDHPTNAVVGRPQIELLYQHGLRAKHLGPFAGMFTELMQPEARLGQLGRAQVPDLYNEQAAAPLQRMWSDRNIEATISTLAKRAFGIELTVNRHAGSQIGLHVGKPLCPEPAIGEVSPYREEVRQLPLAADQGHGVQAFLWILMSLMTQRFDIVMIDEPEAFLHPPQARLLGEILVEVSREGTQLLVSTHSDDFLQGVLTASAGKTDVTVVRLTRPSADSNAVAQVSPAAIRKLFEDPLLRYSSILSGIFYKGVVLCEAEADCKYYSAVLDETFSSSDAGTARPDLLFTQCGGKDRFAKAVSALLATRVPTAIVADIDLLADRAKFEELFDALGGDPASLTADMNVVAAAVSQKSTAPDREYVQHRVNGTLAGSREKTLSAVEVRSIRDVVRSTSGWSLAKQNGRGAIPSGSPLQSFERILAAARTVGLFVLPIGELERFHPTIGGNKQAWLREVFESGAYKDCAEAADFLRGVAAFIADCQ